MHVSNYFDSPFFGQRQTVGAREAERTMQGGAMRCGTAMALAHFAFLSVHWLHIFYSSLFLLFLFFQNFYHGVDVLFRCGGGVYLTALSLCTRRAAGFIAQRPVHAGAPTRCERIREHRKDQHPGVALRGEYRVVGATHARQVLLASDISGPLRSFIRFLMGEDDG
jgi:hypothetical protein